MIKKILADPQRRSEWMRVKFGPNTASNGNRKRKGSSLICIYENRLI